MEWNTTQFIPVLPIRNTVIFPGTALPLRVGRSKSVAAIQKAQEAGSYILTITLKEDGEKEPSPAELYRVGTLVKIGKNPRVGLHRLPGSGARRGALPG